MFPPFTTSLELTGLGLGQMRAETAWGTKALKVSQIQAATLTDMPFTPRYVIEL